MAQLGGIALLTDERYAGSLALFGGIDKARFRRQVGPGDTLEMAIELDQLGSNAGKGHGTATVLGKIGGHRVDAVRPRQGLTRSSSQRP